MTRSYRDIAEDITAGKLEPQFIGTKNYYVLRQELLSILNEKHAIKTAQERKEFESRIAGYVDAISNVKNPNKYDDLVGLITQILDDAPESETRERLTKK